MRGLLIEIAGPLSQMKVGGRLAIETMAPEPVLCEIVGFESRHALAMPFAGLVGVRRGCRALIRPATPGVRPSEAWLGRVVDCFGRPIDGKGPILPGPRLYPFRADPPAAHGRNRVGAPLDEITFTTQEGKLTSGKDLVRPYRGRPMFVGVVLTGFGGDWLIKGSCYVCKLPHEIARCWQCPCGICEESSGRRGRRSTSRHSASETSSATEMEKITVI